MSMVPHTNERAAMRLVVSVPGLVPPNAGALAGSTTETVLVALEDPRERGWLVATLQRHGYRVLTAKHAGHALLMALRFVGRIDVVVTEPTMREMSGAELGARVRAHCPAAELICVTRPRSPQTVLFRVRQVLQQRDSRRSPVS